MGKRTESRESDNNEKTMLRNWCIVPGENIKKEQETDNKSRTYF